MNRDPVPSPHPRPVTGRCRLAAVIATAVFAFATAPAFAARCIPQASGVPALNGPPEFINSGLGAPNYWPKLDDPRWRGALAQSFGTGASEIVSFRALRQGGTEPALYLSWHVKADPFLVSFGDSVKVAISTGAGNGQLMEIFPFTNLNPSNAVAPPSTVTSTLGGGVWNGVPAEPTWLANNTRVWLDTANQQWAVNMRIPIKAGFNDGLLLPAQFNLAFEVRDQQSNDPMGPVAFYRASNTVALNDLAAIPAPANWPQYDIALPPGNAGCDATVRLASNDVGTTNVDGGGVARPNRINLTSPNTFFALPDNATASPIAAGQISATFRIANWGTQPDWNDVADPTNSLWTKIGPALISNAGAINAGTKASIAGGNALTFPWTLTNAERCAFVGQSGVPSASIPGDPSCPNATPTKRLHQCMLVELSGGGLSFSPASVYRNMDYADASVFEREAQVSVAGLNLLGTPRDVYLYVQTLMMPKRVDKPEPGLSLVDYRKVWDILQRGDHQVPGIAMSDKSKEGGPQLPARPPLDGDFEILNQFYPTYVVHAFHDTGETADVRGKTMRVVRPQSSFGYYVHHEGTLTGWDTQLQGAQLISPDFYRIGVPDGGSATVKTRIEAREQDTPPPVGNWWEELLKWLQSLPWWWWIVALFVLLLLWLLLRRKK